jgi:hypothetical protein
MIKHLVDLTHGSPRLVNALCVIAMIAYGMPIGWWCYGRVRDVTVEARAHLIVTHELWTLHPEYRGTPQTWTRFASRLLTDRQLQRRLDLKYGALGEQIGLDYRRDLTVAQMLVVVKALALWLTPAALVALAWRIVARSRRATTLLRRPQPASVRDSRYLP